MATYIRHPYWLRPFSRAAWQRAWDWLPTPEQKLQLLVLVEQTRADRLRQAKKRKR